LLRVAIMTLRPTVWVLAVVFVVQAARPVFADATETRSPDVALALSAGGAATSIGVFALGWHEGHTSSFDGWLKASLIGLGTTLVTPSLGEWYAGTFMTAGLGLRLAGIGVSAVGLASATICFGDCHGENTGPIVILGLGGLVYATGIVWDIATARSTARKANARARPVVLTPSLQTTPSGRSAYGIGIGRIF
jgi:hypothetical protein